MPPSRLEISGEIIADNSNASLVDGKRTNHATVLPARWSNEDRHHKLTVSEDGLDLTLLGTSCIGSKDSAAARADHPIPSVCGIYYYEAEILERGTKGHIGIGFCSAEMRLCCLPGWEEQSWGYHADDGWVFPGAKDGHPYGPTFDTGDIVGCGIDFTQHEAFYTKNGTFLGMAFDSICKDIDLYPSVGMRHVPEAIRANFGHDSFKYDIKDHVQQRRVTLQDDATVGGFDWDLLYGQA